MPVVLHEREQNHWRAARHVTGLGAGRAGRGRTVRDMDTDTEANPWLLAACLLTAWVLIVVRVAVASHEELALLLHPQVQLSLAEPLEGEWDGSLAQVLN